MISDDDWEDGLKILRRYKLDDIQFKTFGKSEDYNNIGYVMGQILMATMDKEWCIGKSISRLKVPYWDDVYRGKIAQHEAEYKYKYHLFLLEKSGDSMAFKTPLYRVMDYDKKYGWIFRKYAGYAEMFRAPLELFLEHNEIALLPKLRDSSFLNWVENPFEVKQ